MMRFLAYTAEQARSVSGGASDLVDSMIEQQGNPDFPFFVSFLPLSFSLRVSESVLCVCGVLT